MPADLTKARVVWPEGVTPSVDAVSLVNNHQSGRSGHKTLNFLRVAQSRSVEPLWRDIEKLDRLGFE